MAASIRLLALALAALAVVACSTRDSAPRGGRDVSRAPDVVPRAEPRSRQGNPPFYEVAGRRYHVMDSSTGYVERGVASWYGKKFHGRLTSNGETYDMYSVSAAHKTLPLPTYARVTNLENGRELVVRINDRGPFVKDRIIDLSYAAAHRLGVVEQGTAFVEVRAIDPKGRRSAEPTRATGGKMYVQVGAFSDSDNADALRGRLQRAGLRDVVVQRDRVNGRRLFRVRVGPVQDVAEFDDVVTRVRDLEIGDAHLAVE